MHTHRHAARRGNRVPMRCAARPASRRRPWPSGRGYRAQSRRAARDPHPRHVPSAPTTPFPVLTIPGFVIAPRVGRDDIVSLGGRAQQHPAGVFCDRTKAAVRAPPAPGGGFFLVGALDHGAAQPAEASSLGRADRSSLVRGDFCISQLEPPAPRIFPASAAPFQRHLHADVLYRPLASART